jgi:hypothetical protein
MHFEVKLTLEQIKTIAIALEAANRLNIGQIMVSHELVAPASNSRLRSNQSQTHHSNIKEAESVFRTTRSSEDNTLHHKFEGLMYNFRGFYHNQIADTSGIPEKERTAFVTYDGPEVLGHEKLEFKQVIE